MKETIARIAQGKLIELTDDQNRLLPVPPMDAYSAAFLGRSLLSSAAVLESQNNPQAGALVADAHIPVMAWRVGRMPGTPFPIMLLTLPTGIELTFQMLPDIAKQMGTELIVQGTTNQSPGPSSGVH